MAKNSIIVLIYHRHKLLDPNYARFVFKKTFSKYILYWYMCFVLWMTYCSVGLFRNKELDTVYNGI
jgi:hypothetical protein